MFARADKFDPEPIELMGDFSDSPGGMKEGTQRSTCSNGIAFFSM
jgi:hypothetical protein